MKYRQGLTKELEIELATEAIATVVMPRDGGSEAAEKFLEEYRGVYLKELRAGPVLTDRVSLVKRLAEMKSKIGTELRKFNYQAAPEPAA